MEIAESSVLIVILRDDAVFSTRVTLNSGINELKRRICDFWNDLSPSVFDLSYDQGLKQNLIDSDYDLQSLACFTSAKGIRSVTLNLCMKLVVGSIDVGSSSCCSNVDDVSGYSTIADVNVLTGVGQRFRGGASEFRLQLLRHCILNGFKVTLLKNEPKRVTAECIKKAETGCLWRVHAATKRELPKFFEIKSMNGVHTCGAGFKDVENPPMSSKLVKSVIVDMVKDRPLIKPKEIIDYFRREFGVTLTYYFAYQGKELAAKEIHGSEEISYHHLEAYVDQLKISNPGSHIVLEKDVETRKFQRLFICFAASSTDFSFCRPVIFLDSTFLKGKFKGCFFAANAKNGNKGLFTICFAVVLKENEDNWYWFLQNLKIAICSDFRMFAFISDRHHGLISSIPKVFPNSFHSYCYWHLDKNLNAALPKRCAHRVMLLELFKKMVYASSHVEFEGYMREFKEIGVKQANDFVDGIAYEHWANAYFEGCRYGDVCSTLAECFNNWISEARNLPITSLVDKVRVKMMAMMSERRDVSASWTTTLCPNMEKILNETINAGKSWLVVKSSDSVYEVMSKKSHRVDLERRCCSCNIWKIDGFPCAHAVRCINAAGLNVYNFIDVYFSVTLFRATYGMCIEPIANADLPTGALVEGSLLPPDVSARHPGRPKKKRIPNTGSSRKTSYSKVKAYGTRDISSTGNLLE